MSDPRFPIGPFSLEGDMTPDTLHGFVEIIAQAPAEFREAVAGLNDTQLDTPYREGGWTIRQVIHHVADSHMNSYIRFKLALTEDRPTIKPYAEDRWAELEDAKDGDVETSLCLIDCLHKRWVQCLRSMTIEQWQRTFNHPERGTVPLDETAALYAWHSKHHLAHITHLRERKGW
ncbi:MAG: putative metal-dependent hydrolase [Candidatus Hydrogenedentes bacterium]|nr:putative metal-dependent hydrolase [Candidatus Hydrogenedentota bacterium]